MCSPTAADINQYTASAIIEVEDGAAHDTVSRVSLALQALVIPGCILVVACAAHPVILTGSEDVCSPNPGCCRSARDVSMIAVQGHPAEGVPKHRDGVARPRESFRRPELFQSVCPWPVRRPACRDRESATLVVKIRCT